MGILTIDSGSDILALGEIAVIDNVPRRLSTFMGDSKPDVCSIRLLRELKQFRSEWTVTALRDMVINFFIKRFEDFTSERHVHGVDVTIYNMPWLDSDRHGNRFIPPHQLINVTTFYDGGVHEWFFYIVGAKPIIINLENNCRHMVQVIDEIDNVIKYYGSGYKKATVDEICRRYTFDSGEAAIRVYMRGNLDFAPAQNINN